MKQTIGTILAVILFLGLHRGVWAEIPIRTESLNALFVTLDRTIANKGIYIQARQNTIDSLQREFTKEQDVEQKFNLSQRIFNIYFDFQNDLALEHAMIMQKLAEELREKDPDYLLIADINLARLLRYTGQLKEATDLLDRISEHKLSPKVHYLYVSECMVNYTFLRDNSLTQTYKEYFDKMADIYRDSVLMYPEKAGIIVKSERFLKQKNPQAALTILHGEYDSLAPFSRRAGTLAYNIALCHEMMRDTVNFKRYLALSAIADLHSGVRGYKSLQRLAVVMHESGDIDRAYSFMKCSIEDAINSNARIRAQEASRMFIMIDDSYQQKVAGQRHTITIMLIFTGITGVLLLISLLVVVYQNAKLVATKRKLSDANLVKEGYLGVFIEEYSNYLSKMNSYYLKSTKILKMRNVDEICQFIEKAFDTGEDLKAFYRKFDATILHIFPTFIEEYNKLTHEKVADSHGEATSLTAEQRIAAFIRLGMKEPDKIALFLRYSLRTVYNYRSQMRSKAKDPKNFEQDIMQIGLKS